MLGSLATLSGPKWIGTALADVTSTGPGPAIVRLKLADITATTYALNAGGQNVPTTVHPLATVGGSVQFSFNTGFPPFTLNRVEGHRFVTLDSVCTHAGCAVGRYQSQVVGQDESVDPPVPILASLMRCPCHGSRYDLEGRVFRDGSGQSTEPAPDDLVRFETSYDAPTDIISIKIPNLSLHISSISVQQQGPNGVIRLKLVIPVTAFSKYEISRQPALAGPLTRVPFATTATGPANQTLLRRTADGDVTVYVDTTGSSGFFVVGVILDDVPY
jgi:Rieske Fe-S protein